MFLALQQCFAKWWTINDLLNFFEIKLIVNYIYKKIVIIVKSHTLFTN